VSEQETGTQNTGNTDAAGTTDTSSHADTGGAGNSETGGNGAASSFTPMTEAEQTAWKEATRKAMVTTITKDVQTKLKSDADIEAAKAKGEFETLAQKRQERIEELERDATERDRADLRAKVAKAHKLPDDLANLLQGDDEAALTESAKLLAKHLKQPTAPDTEGGVGAGTSSSTDTSRPIKHDDGKAKPPAFTFEGREKVPWKRS
jgi:hypothetical protein